jgi:hypothetical protein
MNFRVNTSTIQGKLKKKHKKRSPTQKNKNLTNIINHLRNKNVKKTLSTQLIHVF